MAALGYFTPAEKARIRRYLGFSELFFQIDPRLEGQMDALPARSPDAEEQVRAMLAKLDAIDTKIQSAALSNLDLSKAEDVTFLGPEQIRTLQDVGRAMIQQIAITFELEPKRDFYDAGGSSGGVMPFGG